MLRLTEGVMPAFKLIRADELREFSEVLTRNAWREEDFQVEEEVYDPATAEVEGCHGKVLIDCRRTHAVGVYPVGRGSSWVSDFADDLRAGKFGRPSA